MKRISLQVLRACFLLCVTLLFSGCVTPQNKQYHKVCSSEICSPRELIDSTAIEGRFSVSNYGWDAGSKKGRSRVQMPFYKAWLEYGEDGNPLDPNQKKAIQSRIGTISAENKNIFLVVYVHGWHNNADTEGKGENYDSIAFDDFMAKQVSSVRRLYELSGRTDIPAVFGVFVGWRGESVKTPLLTVASIRGRSIAADRVGRFGVRQDLKVLSDALYQADPRNKMLVYGHSLGGKVLTSAFIEEFSRHPSLIMNPGALIVTVNPAVSADCYAEAFERNEPSIRPVWINITSKDDSTTSDIYKKGLEIQLIESCRSSGEASRYAVGHYAPWITENLCVRSAGSAEIDHGVARITEGPMLGRSFNHLIVNEAGWVFAKSMDAELAYMSFDARSVNSAKGQRLYDWRYADIYEIKLRRTPGFPQPMSLRNIRTDKYLIGHAGGADTADAKHNGYVSTNLIRLMVEAVYSDGEAHPDVQYLSSPDAVGPKASDAKFCEF